MNSSESSRLVDLQSESFPGRFNLLDVADFRFTSEAASREASLARAERTILPTIWSAAVLLKLSHASNAGRTKLSTKAVNSGLFSFSLVWPWNIGSRTKTERIPTNPSRISSAVIAIPLTLIS